MDSNNETWCGSTQVWSATGYAENGRFVADLAAPLVDLLAPQRGERILDVGCGDGALSIKLMHTGATVVGVDSSPELSAAAQAAGVDARLIDAHGINFREEFDAVFSNAALHWMLDPDRVIDGVKRALRPGGRFVAEFGGHANVAAIRTALAAVLQARGYVVRSPWFFPTADEYALRLREHGFHIEVMSLVARPTPLPTGIRGWLDTFAQPFVAGVEPVERNDILDAVETLLAPILRDAGGRWTADYVRLRFAAYRP